MRSTLLFILAAGLFANQAQAARDDLLSSRIDRLINAIGGSNCQFVRNGKTYSPADSAVHIKKKYDYFKDDIDSMDRFIELSATRSMMSDKPYRIKCPGNETELSSSWMSNKAVELGILE